MTLAPSFPGFEVRFVPGVRAVKEYVCPECLGTVSAGVGHVVAWRVDDNEGRRHWHAHCWRLVVRRGRVDGV